MFRFLLRPQRPEWLALKLALLLVLLFNIPFWGRLYAIVSPLDGHGVKMLGLAFLLLTVLSQYVHRNLQRLQPRPAYVVMNEVSSAVEIRDAGRRNVVHESG